jgi:Flp pilus assembly protein TadG
MADHHVMVRPSFRRRRSERGAVLIEFALLAPLLFALALGIFTGGTAYFNKITLTSSAREASRFGATVPEAQCSPTSRCGGMTWAQFVRSQAVMNSAGALTAGQVCVALVSGPGSAPVAADSSRTTAGGTAPCFVDNSVDTGRRVQVAVTRPAQLEVVFFSRTLTLTSRAVTRYEQ